jgi:hypothetical protein
VPNSHALIADATGLPAWLVEIVPAMAAAPDEAEHVVSWVREYRRRHGRDPKIPEVQGAFQGLSKTTA